jgi:3-dehydroquinate synthetase
MTDIQRTSAIVDKIFVATKATKLGQYRLIMPVPTHHQRAQAIHATTLRVDSIISINFPENTHFLIDESLRYLLRIPAAIPTYITSTESTAKEITWLDGFFTNNPIPRESTVLVGIGGGVLLNAAAYIAERANLDFISVPTTILAAADSAIGGLVRINKVDGGKYIKNFYKSVYEPSQIIIDATLFTSLASAQIRWGLSEVIKHGVYQSQQLLDYLASDDFQPLQNNLSLIKAICWTAALKNEAIVYDPDSLGEGGLILRGGHFMALKIEEDSDFKVSHGEAVAVGVYQDSLLNNRNKLHVLDQIYTKLDLPRSLSEL